MSRLTLNLPDEVSAALTVASREARRTPEELAGELIRRALLARQFEQTRESLLQSLGEDALKTDDDVFKQIS